jgi:hypothetical protein
VGPRAGLERRKTSLLNGVSIPRPYNHQSVAILTELPGPHLVLVCKVIFMKEKRSLKFENFALSKFLFRTIDSRVFIVLYSKEKSFSIFVAETGCPS